MSFRYHVFLLVMLAFCLTASRAVRAKPEFLAAFQKTYSPSMSSALGKAACKTCHLRPMGGKGWNAFGNALHAKYEKVKDIRKALKALEKADSDKDRISNIKEIKAGTLPGDKKSKPTRRAMSAPVKKMSLCELCEKPLISGKIAKVYDRSTGKEHLYRCVHCAMVAMQQFSDSQAIIPSGLTGQPVTLVRKQDKWTVKPASAGFLILSEQGGECLDRHQAFRDTGEWKEYLKKRPRLQALKPRFYGIGEVRKMVEAGMP